MWLLNGEEKQTDFYRWLHRPIKRIREEHYSDGFTRRITWYTRRYAFIKSLVIEVYRDNKAICKFIFENGDVAWYFSDYATHTIEFYNNSQLTIDKSKISVVTFDYEYTDKEHNMMLNFIRNCRQHNVSLKELFEAYRNNDATLVAYWLRVKSYTLGYNILMDDYGYTDDMIETGYSRQEIKLIGLGLF